MTPDDPRFDLPPALSWAPPGEAPDAAAAAPEPPAPPPPPPAPTSAEQTAAPAPDAGIASRAFAAPVGRGPVLGCVLTGGGSRRMGEVKALVKVRNVPMARLAADALVSGGAQRVVLVGGEPSVFAELWLDGVPDRWPRIGPLGGLATAVNDGWPDKLVREDGSVPQAGDADEMIVVVAACDQPDLGGGLIVDLIMALRQAPAQTLAAAPVTPDGRRHPLPSAWRASAGPVLERLVASGAREAAAAFDQVPVVDVPATDAELRDIDTKAELVARAEGPYGGDDGALEWGAGAGHGDHPGSP